MVKLNTMLTTVRKTRFKPPMSESYQSLKATSISPVNISYIRRFIRRTKESQITTLLRDHNFQATKTTVIKEQMSLMSLQRSIIKAHCTSI